ncbi:probable bifunctional methylenetetrahydrofolate dehydrogenase/cyclohydrolase 2 isoform X5 [Pipistrellus kuhlii]|uniref:probable bifunctional methylenetetrahydrofolate dehydrogenase/cyclohydrolase 2 isoform X5 n=1 Tax=Pipistrellus kuhlii TaxID=59472 RepID=UPI00174EDFDE|nr:probable bifunctional methylenetetrahydrofolate dehydrogenase/cyclohydrolase 2 isoform X5 [Pipistrellus kuhlii]
MPPGSRVFAVMALSARVFSLLRGRLGRMGAPGAAGPAFRAFRSSGARASREKRFHLPEVATVCLPTGPHPQSSFLNV